MIYMIEIYGKMNIINDAWKIHVSFMSPSESYTLFEIDFY